MNDNHQDTDKQSTLLQLLGSVLAAFFGVQSLKNYRRDANSNNAGKLIVLGILVTIVFVLIVASVARYAAG
ncbi:MAG: DUF2970 domain-containing protein [Gammaproteobacteria bacterium]|nr:DUF2970 domain-containing protein [Gammaproteobacteria bacterium]